jgi:MFS family permease
MAAPTMPKTRRKRKNKSGLRLGDRIVTAILGTVLGSIVGAVGWGILYWRSLVLRRSMDLPFWTIFLLGAFMGVIGFLVGPERMMDIFENKRHDREDDN